MHIQLLEKTHNRKGFWCEEDTLTDYIRNQVSQDIRKNLAACFVTTDEEGNVLGYYTLSSQSLGRSAVPEKYQVRNPVHYSAPVILLGQLARDIKTKGTGMGEFLLIDALFRSYTLSTESIGAMAVVVDPLHERAAAFYRKFGFIDLSDSSKMFLSMVVIKQLI